MQLRACTSGWFGTSGTLSRTHKFGYMTLLGWQVRAAAATSTSGGAGPGAEGGSGQKERLLCSHICHPHSLKTHPTGLRPCLPTAECYLSEALEVQAGTEAPLLLPHSCPPDSTAAILQALHRLAGMGQPEARHAARQLVHSKRSELAQLLCRSLSVETGMLQPESSGREFEQPGAGLVSAASVLSLISAAANCLALDLRSGQPILQELPLAQLYQLLGVLSGAAPGQLCRWLPEAHHAELRIICEGLRQMVADAVPRPAEATRAALQAGITGSGACRRRGAAEAADAASPLIVDGESSLLASR